MKKFLYLLFFVSIFATGASAQVTIGSTDAPRQGAVLELRSDTLGFLPPRVALTDLYSPNPLSVHVQGMVVFNTGAALPMGLYYNSGTHWVHLDNPASVENWFYMPSIAFDVSAQGVNFTKNLYDEYQKQFANPAAGSETGAVLSVLPARTDLKYYVTDYDRTVFNVKSVDADGLMTYDVVGSATDASYINIVFVEK